MVLPGDVFKLLCHFPETTKQKYLILIKDNPYEFFMINSEINDYIKEKPHLYECQIDVPYEDHKAFLQHDSIANCSEKVDITTIFHEKQVVFDNLINHRVGRLADYVIRNIINNLEEDNSVLVKKDINAIVSALKATL